MTLPRLTPVLLAALAAACASSSSDVTRPEDADVYAYDAEAIREAERAARAPDLTVEGALRREYWNEPGVRRWFLDSYAAVSEVEPQVTLNEQEILEDVSEYIAEGRLDAARETLENTRGAGASAAMDYMLGNVYQELAEPELAAQAYADATDGYRNFQRAWRNLGMVRTQLEEHAGAVEALSRAVQLGDVTATTYGLLGVGLARMERHLAAETAFRMAMMLEDPERVENWQLGLAQTLFAQQRFAEVASLCDAMIAADPEEAQYWLLQASAYVGLQKPLEAAENYEIADRLGGSTPGSLANLGDIYTNAEIFDLATDAYGRALELDEAGAAGSVERALRAAQVMTARSAQDEARQLLARVEALHGEALAIEQQKSVLRLRAQMAMAEGGTAAEAEVLREIVALDPLDGQSLIRLGMYEAEQGNPEQAVFYYDRAANVPGHEADAYVRHAQLLVGQGRFAEALGKLERAQEIDPRDNVQSFLDQVERRVRSGG